MTLRRLLNHTSGIRTGTQTGTRTGTRTGTQTGTRVGTRVGTGATTIRNRRIVTFSGRRIWWNGGWRTLIGIGLLTPWVVGGVDYYPEAYVAYGQPLCTGNTDDGCALRWQDVATDDGSIIPQCVQYCPQERRPVAQPPAPAPAPRTGCEVVVYQDKDLAGPPFRTTEDQPLLNNELNKRILSIEVIAGTWDFSTEPQYAGDAMRLAPGTYRDLDPNWEGQISSFQCVQ